MMTVGSNLLRLHQIDYTGHPAAIQGRTERKVLHQTLVDNSKEPQVRTECKGHIARGKQDLYDLRTINDNPA